VKPHDLVATQEPEALIMKEFEEACIGTCETFGRPIVALYDYNKIIELLMKDMSYEEAVDYFSFNIGGAWVGDYTPAFAFLFAPDS
jgi:hypothetical protein